MATLKQTGEPYILTGNRIAFTSWYYVRPSGLGWFNKKGDNVTVAGSEKLGEANIMLNEAAQGICLVAKSALRSDEIIKAEMPYEEGGIALVTVFKEDGIYRAWGCTGWGDLKGRGVPALCYYESEDGFNWKRPDCGLVDFEGNKNNNILKIFSGYASWGTVFLDPSAKDSERYKCISEHHFDKDEYREHIKRFPEDTDPKCNRDDVNFCIAVRGAVSPDGLNWTFIEKPIAMIHSDTQIVAYYDIKLGKYVGYFRDWMVGLKAENAESCDNNTGWLRSARRAIGRAETDNFYHWPLSEIVLEPDLSMSPNQVLYTNCKTTLPGVPDNHLMFPAVWDTATDQTHLILATSHDSKTWNYVPLDKVFNTGNYGDWDGGCVFGSPNLIELPNGDFILPYIGFNVPHKYPRKKATRGTGYAIWPKGRLMGIKAENKGSFTTVAVIAKSEKMIINAEIAKKGYIEIEVADLDGNPIPGREFKNSLRLTGDCYQEVIRWKDHDDLGIKCGKPVMLRFRMDSATIYYVDFV